METSDCEAAKLHIPLTTYLLGRLTEGKPCSRGKKHWAKMIVVRGRAVQYIGDLWVPQFADICDLTHTLVQRTSLFCSLSLLIHSSHSDNQNMNTVEIKCFCSSLCMYRHNEKGQLKCPTGEKMITMMIAFLLQYLSHTEYHRFGKVEFLCTLMLWSLRIIYLSPKEEGQLHNFSIFWGDRL